MSDEPFWAALQPHYVQHGGGYYTITFPSLTEEALPTPEEPSEEPDESGDPATKRLIASVLPRNGGETCKHCGGHVKHAKFVRMALMCGFCDRPMGGL